MNNKECIFKNKLDRDILLESLNSYIAQVYEHSSFRLDMEDLYFIAEHLNKCTFCHNKFLEAYNKKYLLQKNKMKC